VSLVFKYLEPVHAPVMLHTIATFPIATFRSRIFPANIGIEQVEVL
jgi:hypothetical protein